MTHKSKSPESEDPGLVLTSLPLARVATPAGIEENRNVGSPSIPVASRSESLAAEPATTRSDDPPRGVAQHVDHADLVEAALASALATAAAAGQWDVVGRLARELEARRVAVAPANVVPLTAARKARA